ncbi:D-2-hydroxyacid dehydrogenase [Desulfitobacterium hafniense]|uniref:D-2-hydroxyacid dehydrogenase n=1 Tax=Desulfitobacterium hafniense TaxID=49338 RepID=UPI00036A75A6|nr:D-2-hydroxyacid dehydrogenase [Desulfitobacterium hafniense]
MEIKKIAILFQSTNKVPIEFEERHLDMIRQTVPGVNVVRAYTESELLPGDLDADVLITWGQYSPVEFCTKATNLKWIHAVSAGIEGLTIPEIMSLDAVMSNTKGIHGIPMAEHTMALILASLRQLPVLLKQQQEKVWLKHKPDETQGKTVGIIGLGSIGEEVAKKCKLFGMKVVATKRTPVTCEWVDELYPDHQLDKLLCQADFVVVVVPLTPETTKLIGEKEFKLMKKTSYIINIARGKVIDEKALVKALQDGDIGGAGLDCVEDEPLPQDSPLWDMPNVIITPHTAADSPFYMDRAMNQFCESLKKFINNQDILNKINKNKGY